MFRAKSKLRNFQTLILQKLNLFDNQTVYFEGGLGSQIISYITYCERIKTSPDIKVNLDYFKNIVKDYTQQDGLSRWSWRLNQYGINLNSLPQHKLLKKFILKYFFTRSVNQSTLFNNFRKNKSQEYLKIFPINFENIEKFLQIAVPPITHEYCVVHIRRGDYLQVASNVIPVSEITDLILKIRHLLPKNILVTSDSILPDSDKDLFNKVTNGLNCIYIDPAMPDHLVHDLMRTSKVLLASNSTFSFTAGLLSEKSCLFFFPTKMFGEGQDPDLRAFELRQPFGYLVD